MRYRLLSLALLLPAACGDDASSAGGGSGSGTSVGEGVTGEDTLGNTGSTASASSSSSTTTEGPDATSAETGSSSTGTVGPDQPIAWQTKCIAPDGYDLRRLGPELECATIDVPLDWDTPDGEMLPATALRIRADTPERVGTFWALAGGPGGSGLGYALDEGWVDEITAAGWDIVITPHRGSYAPRLTCSNASALGTGCRQSLEDEWGEGLRHFNTRWAAHDVHAFVERERASDDEPVVVYGVSYGTYWAQFFEGEFPGVASSLILDSAVPTNADLAMQEYLTQDIATQLLQTCVDDPTCGPAVGFDSGEAFAEALLTTIDDGDCGGNDTGLWEETDYRFFFAFLINLQTARNYVPLLAALLTRCDPELTQTADTAMNALFAQAKAAGVQPAERSPRLDGMPPNPAILFSEPLQAAVIATSMLAPDATPAEAELDAERHVASLGFGSLVAAVQRGWGTLPAVELNRNFVSQSPILVLNASYDLQTVFPWAERVAAQHGQPLVEFADARHGITLTGTGGKSLMGDSCARSLMLGFMSDPTAPPDTACVESLPGVDVSLQRPDLGPTTLNAFGTDDPWSLLPPVE